MVRRLPGVDDRAVGGRAGRVREVRSGRRGSHAAVAAGADVPLSNAVQHAVAVVDGRIYEIGYYHDVYSY